MSFRQNNERPRHWQRWLARHRESLAEAGIPDWVYIDEMRWFRFLGEGGLDYETGWRVEMLSALQAERFRSFLIREFREDDYLSCLRALQAVVTSGPPA
jgi:hypothetical protein